MKEKNHKIVVSIATLLGIALVLISFLSLPATVENNERTARFFMVVVVVGCCGW